MPRHTKVRLLCWTAVGACAVLVLTAAQSNAIPMTVDLATVLSRLGYGAASLLGAAILWLGKKGLDSINRVESQVDKASQQLSTISHELFGVGGNNGMRSELKDMSKLVHRHSEVLVVLADRADITFSKDAQ